MLFAAYRNPLSTASTHIFMLYNSHTVNTVDYIYGNQNTETFLDLCTLYYCMSAAIRIVYRQLIGKYHFIVRSAGYLCSFVCDARPTLMQPFFSLYFGLSTVVVVVRVRYRLLVCLFAPSVHTYTHNIRTFACQQQMDTFFIGIFLRLLQLFLHIFCALFFLSCLSLLFA